MKKILATGQSTSIAALLQVSYSFPRFLFPNHFSNNITMKKYLFVLIQFLLVGTGVYGQVPFSLNSSGTSHLLWPFGPNCSWANRYETYNGVNAQWTVAYGSSAHTGADVNADDWNWSSGNADEGQELYACGAGTVIFVDNTAGMATTCGYSFGRQIIIRFTDSNFAVRYAHLQSVATGLVAGSTVTAGQYIGRLGKTGLTGVSPCTAHLHIVLYKNVTNGSTALTYLQSGSMPPSTCAAVFSLDATTSGSTATCNTPTSSQVYALNIGYNNITAYSAYNQTGTTQWQFGYKLTTTSIWTNTATTTNGSLNISGLQAGTTYNLNCRALCNGNWTAWSQPITFTTLSSTCNTPTSSQVYALNIAYNNITAYSAYNQTGTTQWQFGYKLTTTSIWTNTATTTNGSLNISGLQAGTTYNLNCRALCNGNWTAWSQPITFTTLSSSSGGGTTPANDNPCNATTLSVNSSCYNTSGTTVGATNTTNPGPTTSCTFYGPDVWYKFQMPSTGVATIRTTAGTMTDAMMAIYYGNCSSLIGVTCEDDNTNGNGSTMPVITITGSAGTWGYIRIWRYNGGTGTFNLCILNYSTVNKTVEEEVGSINAKIPTALNISPNPATNEVSISFDHSDIGDNATIVIYNTAGQAILQTSVQQGKATQTLDVSALVPGLYIVQLRTRQGTQMAKLVIANH